MGRTLKRESCNLCGSNDNLITYEGTDGNEYQRCVTPNCNININKSANTSIELSERLSYDHNGGEEGWFHKQLDFIYVTIESRGLTYDTAVKCDIKHAIQDVDSVYAFTYHNLSGQIDIKYKWPNNIETGKKRMSWAVPSSPNKSLYLLHLATDYTKPLIITEGEFDAASLVQEGYQAVSVTAGADSIEKDLKFSMEHINKYPEIWLALDNDEPGKLATEKAKRLLSHKIVKIVDFSPFKDANEALQSDVIYLHMVLKDPEEIVPEGLVFGSQIDFEKLQNKVVKSIPLPWPKLNESMRGLEYGCMYLLLAGTGAGKSTLLRELVYYYRKSLSNIKIANFFLEENEDVTPDAYIALDQNVPLGDLRRSKNLVNNYINVGKNLLGTDDNLVFIDKKFKRDTVNILKNIEYLVVVKKFDLIIIDHISYLIGRTGVSNHGERRDIDEFLYKLQDLVQRLGCIVVAVSHVNESDSKKRWDQGETPNIYSGRGSKALAQIPDGIIGLSRDMSNEYAQSVLNLYNLKNRWFGKLGLTDSLVYIDKTGRMLLKE